MLQHFLHIVFKGCVLGFQEYSIGTFNVMLYDALVHIEILLNAVWKATLTLLKHTQIHTSSESRLTYLPECLSVSCRVEEVTWPVTLRFWSMSAACELIITIHFRCRNHAVGKRTPTSWLADDNGPALHFDPVCAGELGDWIQTRGQCDSLCQQSGPLSQPPGDVSLLHTASVQAGEGQCWFCSQLCSCVATEEQRRLLCPLNVRAMLYACPNISVALFGLARHPMFGI